MALTERFSPVIDRLNLEIEILTKIAPLAFKIGLFFANQWFVARDLSKEIKTLRAQIPAMIQEADDAELDPDDKFTEILLDFQRVINKMVQSHDKYLRSDLSLGARWRVRWSRKLLIASHTDLGWIRMAIMEHDADVSPIMGERFTSADDLIAALHRDVAA